VPRAATVALTLQTAMTALPPVALSDSATHARTLKCTVTAGITHRVVAGGPAHGRFNLLADPR
jgi:hypothetical protein